MKSCGVDDESSADTVVCYNVALIFAMETKDSQLILRANRSSIDYSALVKNSLFHYEGLKMEKEAMIMDFLKMRYKQSYVLSVALHPPVSGVGIARA